MRTRHQTHRGEDGWELNRKMQDRNIAQKESQRHETIVRSSYRQLPCLVRLDFCARFAIRNSIFPGTVTRLVNEDRIPEWVGYLYVPLMLVVESSPDPVQSAYQRHIERWLPTP